jgi:EmrB/QacA subfamily drug resistance transporter
VTASAAAPADGGGASLRSLLPLIMVISAGALIVNLDTVAVNVALDTLSRDLDASLSTVQWVVTAYVLALAAVVPLTGWASHRLGGRRLWLTALCLFIGASALSGLAWSVESLIAFRVLQGLGGGMVLPAGHALIVHAAQGRRLGSTMSVVNLPLLIGPVLGPFMGGSLVDSLGWRSIFYANVPVCAAALVVALRVVPKSEPEPDRKLDVRGLLLLSPGLTLLVYGLSQASSAARLGDPLTLGSFAVGVALIAAFVVNALRRGSESALIDVSLFGRRAFAAPALIGFLFSFMMAGALVLYPLYWQIVRDTSALHAGLLIGPQGVGSLITIIFIGRLSDRYGAARLAPIGLLILLAGTIVWARATPDTPAALLAAGSFVRGLGISFLGTPAYAAAYQALARSEIPRGTTAYNIVQRCGTAFGVAVAIVVLQQGLGRAVPDASQGELRTDALGELVRAGQADSIASAFSQSFVVLAVVTVVTFLPALLLPWRGAGRASEPPPGEGLDRTVERGYSRKRKSA